MSEFHPENLPTSDEAPRTGAPEVLETESRQEETLEELAERETAKTEESIQEISKRLQNFQKPIIELSPAQREEKIQRYQEKYIPEYLRDEKNRGSLLNKAMNFFLKTRFEKSGLENIPEEGPFLVVSNHFGADTEYLSALLKDFDTHIAASKMIHWKRSPIKRWFLKKIRAVAAPESLEHLSAEEKSELLERMPDGFEKTQYQKIIDREKGTSSKDNTAEKLNFIRESVALLSRGDVVVVFPEGLWLYEGGNDMPRAQTMYQGYEGIEIISRQFEKLTGKELPVIPIAIHADESEKRKVMDIGTPLTLSQNDSDLSGIDWCMAHVARFLPEEQRGYYGDMAKQLNQITETNALEI